MIADEFRTWLARPPATFAGGTVQFSLRADEPAESVELSVGADLRVRLKPQQIQADQEWLRYAAQLDESLLVLLVDRSTMTVDLHLDAHDFPVGSIPVGSILSGRFSRDYVRALRTLPEHIWGLDYTFVREREAFLFGWALATGDDFGVWVDGRRATVERSRNKRVMENYWHAPNAARLGFIARATLYQPGEYMRVEPGVESTGSVRFFPPAFEYLGDRSKIVTPPIENIRRVSGPHSNRNTYINKGYTEYLRLNEILRRHGVETADPDVTILDWGSGCGRVTRHFLALERGAERCFGIDIDAENVAWSNANLASGRFKTVDLYPPIDFDDNSFDVIASSSVLSHLNRVALDGWLKEMARVLKPGGRAVLSYHGDASTLINLSRRPEALRVAREEGFFDGIRSADLDGHVADKEYYRQTFLSDTFAREAFGKYFRVIEIVPATLSGTQNAAVLTKD